MRLLPNKRSSSSTNQLFPKSPIIVPLALITVLAPMVAFPDAVAAPDKMLGPRIVTVSLSPILGIRFLLLLPCFANVTIISHSFYVLSRDNWLILSKAAKVASRIPKFIITDGMTAYPEGIEKVFGADAKHIKMKGITHEININLIERFHSTLKQRTKIMRGLKTFDTARVVLNGFILDYNFFRPHMALEGKTPAREAKIYLPFVNWEGIVRYQS